MGPETEAAAQPAAPEVEVGLVVPEALVAAQMVAAGWDKKG